MANWKITPTPLGANFIMKEVITVGLATGLQIWFPYLVFFLTDGKRKILGDCGICIMITRVAALFEFHFLGKSVPKPFANSRTADPTEEFSDLEGEVELPR